MRSEVADVIGNVKYIRKSVFRHQKVAGGSVFPPQKKIVWGATAPPDFTPSSATYGENASAILLRGGSAEITNAKN